MSSAPIPIATFTDQPPVWGWVRVRALVIDSLPSPHSRRAYATALDDFRRWSDASPRRNFTCESIQQYRLHLESRAMAVSSVNLHLTAIRKLAREAAANGLLSHEAAAAIVKVKGDRPKVARTSICLTREQAQVLLDLPAPDTLRGKRDRALLALLLGCGLRRDELANLSWDRVEQREKRWVIAEVGGKGGRFRSVPMPTWAKNALDLWTDAGGIHRGLLFRAIKQKGDIGEGLTAQGVYLIVRGYADRLGIKIAPHNLRRTFAKLAHRGRAPLEQIQLSLGHESIMTTVRYLNVQQDLADAPCDHLGIDRENL